MELKVRNFAKILDADIKVNGITIIAGNNNTGKSTIGKILDAVFNATYSIKDKMYGAKRKLLAELLRKDVESNQSNDRKMQFSGVMFNKFAMELLDSKEEEREDIYKKYEEYFLIPRTHISEFRKMANSHIQEIEQIEESNFSKEIYSNYFGEVFHEQINSLYHQNERAEIILTIKDKDVQLIFEKDRCIQEIRQLDIFNKSLYIDDPFILDEMNSTTFLRSSQYAMHKRNILLGLMPVEKKEVEEKAIYNLLIENKLEKIMQIMNQVVSGKIVRNQKYVYQISEDSSKAVDVASLSTGLKAFVILKQLLLNGSLQEKDVIVLDEPEIHLHPEWQLLYAEIIVLLQKKFDFHIVITTHSAHFMEALELYSKKYGISDRCNYYLTSLQEDGAVFENVTGNIDKIYKQMVDPTLLLSNLREDLETEYDEL